MNSNIKEDDSAFADTVEKPHSSFKNTRKLSIFGKSDSRRTTDFTLSSNIDENAEYERKCEKELNSWFKLMENAKEDYIKINQNEEPQLTIEDLPENHRNFLKNQMDALNSYLLSESVVKLQKTYLDFLVGVKMIESKKGIVYDTLKQKVEEKSANAKDKLFP